MTDPSRPNSEPQTAIRIAIADDHPVVREGVAGVLSLIPGMAVVAKVSTGREAVALWQRDKPDLLLIDLRMPELDGLEAIKAIRDVDPAAAIIVLTMCEGDEDIFSALRAGARGYLLKDAPPEQLIECIQTVRAGKLYVPPDIAGRLAERVTLSPLTPREQEVLQSLAQGLSNKQIAEFWGISEGTVKTHLKNILDKLNAGNRTEAITIAVRRGLVRIDGTH